MTTTSSLVICNRTASALTYRVSVRAAGETDDPKQYIYYNRLIAANDSSVAVLGLTLKQGDAIWVYCVTAGLSFSVFGAEST